MNKKGEILLVDKDSLEVQHYMSILKGAGHGVWCAYTGKEAIETFKSHPPDIVVSDTGLPDIDGINLTRSIKQIREDTCVVLMGEWPTIEFIKTAIMTGAYDVLSKPVQAEKLCNLINSVISAKYFKLQKVDIHKQKEPDIQIPSEINKATYDDQGLWVAKSSDGNYLLGISVQGWISSGKLIYVSPPEKGTYVRKGEVLLEILSSEGKIGQISKIISPVEGEVIDVNEDYNREIVRAICNPAAAQNWMTPILKIKPTN